MAQFFALLICVVAGIYLAKQIVRYVLPRLLVWLVKRKVNQHMRQTYGDEYADAYAREFGKRRRREGESEARSSFFDQRRRRAQRRRRPGKIFGSDVGEYVEFEDIRTYHSVSDQTGTRVSYKEESQVTDVEWEDIP